MSFNFVLYSMQKKKKPCFLIPSIPSPSPSTTQGYLKSNLYFPFSFQSPPFQALNPPMVEMSLSVLSKPEIGCLFLPTLLEVSPSPFYLSLWMTRDLLTKIEKKNTFHRSFLSRCLNARAIFQLPYDHPAHGHSCQQKNRKQESPCEFDLTEDRFVTSL